MLRAYKYRLLPTETQRAYFDECFGACRFVYNLALESKIHAYTKGANISGLELSRQLTDLKKAEGMAWLKRAPSQSIQNALTHLDTAYTAFFAGRAEFPKFKSKRAKQSFKIPSYARIDFNSWSMVLPKMGPVEFCRDRTFSGELRNVTISKTTTGKYFASVLVETGAAHPKAASIDSKTAIGIDLGITHFATLSDGTKIENPRFLKTQLKRLRIEQRSLERKFKKGQAEQSRSYIKQRLVVSLLFERIKNQRRDFLHKLSTSIVKGWDNVCIEDLNISGMKQNRVLSAAISDVGWGIFRRYLTYKAVWYGKNLLPIGMFQASTKICSSCGRSVQDLKITDREWTCECGVLHDRDVNAAINIKNFGLRVKPKTANVGCVVQA